MTYRFLASLRLIAAVSLHLGLAACGGGSDGWVGIPANATAAPPSLPSEPPPVETTAPVTRTIGGKVAGLAENAKVVLLNNGSDALTLTTNGPFRFPSAVPVDAGYAVTLNVQPLWQACTVANGSGTAATDVADVEVSCDYSPAQVSTLAGSVAPGFNDATGTAASFNAPAGVAVDQWGNLYVADTENHRIRKIDPGGAVTTLAGSASPGLADGLGTAASFRFPSNIAVDRNGNLYVTDTESHSIRKITPTGQVSTLAGSTTPGSADGVGTAASFDGPYGVAVDANANVYVADLNNNRIRKITPTGVVTTLAGWQRGSADGTGTAASFFQPAGIAVDAGGHLYVSDYGNNIIRKITPEGLVTTLAGSGLRRTVDGKGAAASFLDPVGMAVDASGTVFVAEYLGNVIRKITPAGDVTILAGASASGSIDGVGEAARFDSPHGLAIDADGQLYVADSLNHMIRKMAPVR
jgi:sugar lactone lactonase YvrE